MRDYVIMTDSCCDLPAGLAEELELFYLPLTVHLDGDDYRNLLDGSEIGFEEFYARLETTKEASTSAVSVGDFETAMRELLQQGKDILCVSFSSGLSTTYQSAVIAAEDLRQEFPEAKVEVVDSLCASLGQGLLVYLCAQQKRQGRTLDEVCAYAKETIPHLCHWFTVGDLEQLKRGGRVSPTTAWLGTMLSIKPVLHVDDEGHLIPVSKSRGRRASLLALADKMEQTALEPENQTVFISHGTCLEDIEFLKDEIRRRMGVKQFVTSYVGPVIGSHTGPSVAALFFLGAQR